MCVCVCVTQVEELRAMNWSIPELTHTLDSIKDPYNMRLETVQVCVCVCVCMCVCVREREREREQARFKDEKGKRKTGRGRDSECTYHVCVCVYTGPAHKSASKRGAQIQKDG